MLIHSTLFALSSEDKATKRSLYPYTVKGITYYPHKVAVGTEKEVLASWYGEYFHGRKTAMGNIYDMHGYSAAHKTLPLGTILLVTNPKNGKSLKVKVDDRGPFWNNRELDLSMGAAEYLGTKRAGVAKVKYRVVFVPKIVDTLKPLSKDITPLTPTYNVGYSAMSYSIIDKGEKYSLFEIGNFSTKKQANEYLKKFKKYFPKAYVYTENYIYKVKFSLSINQEKVIENLKKLKRIGLITGYGICWTD